LHSVERPKTVDVVSWAAGNGDRSENGDYLYGKKRLREIDRRIRFLLKRMEIAQIVDPARQTNREQVYFGATVTYCDEDGAECTVRIVGIDETQSDQGEISWVSPIARALLRSSVGDLVTVRAPGGETEFEITAIVYE
jgi:transcription elongation factor GreB